MPNHRDVPEGACRGLVDPGGNFLLVEVAVGRRCQPLSRALFDALPARAHSSIEPLGRRQHGWHPSRQHLRFPTPHVPHVRAPPPAVAEAWSRPHHEDALSPS